MSLRDKTERVESPVKSLSQFLLSDRVFPYLLIAGAGIWLAIIYAYPLVRTVWYSFLDVGLIQQSAGTFVGL